MRYLFQRFGPARLPGDLANVDAIGLQRLHAAVDRPMHERPRIIQKIHEHHFMVAFQEMARIPAVLLQAQKPVEHIRAVGPPINIIADEHKHRFADRFCGIAIGLDQVQHAVEKVGAPMDVTYSVNAHAIGNAGRSDPIGGNIFERYGRLTRHERSPISVENTPDC